MSERADLLLELGCEELPARLLGAQSKLLAQGLGQRLAAAGLIESTANIQTLATPRRLALRVPQVLARQADRELERKGPAVQAAFDADGQPTRAAEGFARSVGLGVEQLEKLETEQGAWLYARITEPGRALAELLAEQLEETVREMAGARSMRWSDRSERFLRPVRWLLALHGEQVIELEAFGLKADRLTHGHRIHAPGTHPVASAADYEAVLEQAYVLADGEKRQRRIAGQIAELVEQSGLGFEANPELLAENAGLTEWPVAVIGQFEAEFLEVPEEALISSMQQHQKCFPLRAPDGALSNHFVAIANIESRDVPAMTSGFERVIRPRLADARFFWQQDCKMTLDARRSRLEEVLFQEKLGSVAAKTERLATLAAELAPSLGAAPGIARRSALLCKSDLVTEMVGEFPELQGIMGGHYARVDGEPAEVAAAIASHYQPRQAGDALPEDPAGLALALADRLDTVVGIFAAGKKPKGGKDPFALRRAALGIIRILEASGCPLSLAELIETAARALSSQIDVDGDIRADVEAFIIERLRSHAAEAGIEANTVHAVAAGKTGSIADFMARAHAVQAFAADPRAESLIAANKRASNLLRQAESEQIGNVKPELLQDDAESALFEAIQGVEEQLSEHLARQDYPAALAELAGIRDAVDHFFDQVMVMCDEAEIRANRLALLKRLAGLIADIADLARLGR